MANTILTATAVTREALRILHQKLNFVGSINRQYDASFAKKGARIGDSLKIRLPNQYVVRTGRTLSAQDTTETSLTLQVQTQKGVDINFSSAELTMSLDDFSKRVLDPAMSVLAANIEADAMTMYKDVPGSIWDGNAMVYDDVLEARVLLQRGLAPVSGRTANLNSRDMADLVKDTKDLFNAQSALARQYSEGHVGRAAGFDFVENTLWPGHVRGAANNNYVCNTASGIVSGSATVTVSGGSGAILQGDVFTIAGVYGVHPETRASTGVPQQFVATADAASGATALNVAPTPVTSGARQNVTIESAGAGKALTFEGALGNPHGTSLLYHEDAFAFATADLVMPSGVDFAQREVLDGISMRIVRQYDINSDNFPCRLDLLYGYRTLRAEHAARLHFH